MPLGTASRIGSSIVSMNPREKRVRRVAEKRGLVLRKCKLRDPEATGYGKYQLLDHGTVVFGQWGSYGLGFGATLDEIDAWLADERKSLP